MYKIIAIIAPSGGGKDTLVNEICRLAPDLFHRIINTTTRPKRQNEINGKDYWFIDKINFKTLAISKKIIGYTYFNDWYYGTALSSLSTKKPNIGVFNPEAIRQLNKNKDIDLTVIWLHTSDKQRLLRQLNREENPDVDEIIRRFQADKEDFNQLQNLPSIIHLNNEYQNDLNKNITLILNLVSPGQK